MNASFFRHILEIRQVQGKTKNGIQVFCLTEAFEISLHELLTFFDYDQLLKRTISIISKLKVKKFKKIILFKHQILIFNLV